MLFFSLSHNFAPLLLLCSCQSVRRVGQTHSHPQRVTPRGHCQRGPLTDLRLLSRADTGDKLDPCSGGSWSEAPGVAVQTVRVVMRIYNPTARQNSDGQFCNTNDLPQISTSPWFPCSYCTNIQYTG